MTSFYDQNAKSDGREKVERSFYPIVLAYWHRLSVRLSVTRVGALRVDVGNLKLYHRVSRTALPIHFFRHFCCYLHPTLFCASVSIFLQQYVYPVVHTSFSRSLFQVFLVRPVLVLVVQWLSVGLVIERSLVRLPAGALSSQLGQLSLPSLRGR